MVTADSFCLPVLLLVIWWLIIPLADKAASATKNVHSNGTEYIGVCYYYTGESKSWSDAQEGCKELGGSLVSITSEAMNLWLLSFLSTDTDRWDFFWIGLTDFPSEGTFRKVDGTVWDGYTNWDSGEPNDAGGDEDCAEMMVGNGYWNDQSCSQLHGSVCEIIVNMTTLAPTLPSSSVNSSGTKYNGVCYAFTGQNMSWGNALEGCQELGGSLVTITSGAMNSWLRSLHNDWWVDSPLYDDNGTWNKDEWNLFWIGLNDRNSEGTFAWVGGSGFVGGYTNWDSGEPNDAAEDEDCVEMVGRGNGFWNDHTCSQHYGSLCEIHIQDINDAREGTEIAMMVSIPSVVAISCCLVGLLFCRRRRKEKKNVQQNISLKAPAEISTFDDTKKEENDDKHDGGGEAQSTDMQKMEYDEEEARVEDTAAPVTISSSWRRVQPTNYDQLAEKQQAQNKMARKYMAFISHCKADSGICAVHVKGELAKFYASSKKGRVRTQIAAESLFFLDNDNLHDLQQLLSAVQHSNNLVLLLSHHYFSRPWCLLELWAAVSGGKNIIPVNIIGAGIPPCDFEKARAYAKDLRNSPGITQECIEVLEERGASVDQVQSAVNRALDFIAKDYHSQAPMSVRYAEMSEIYNQLDTKGYGKSFWASSYLTAYVSGGKRRSLTF